MSRRGEDIVISSVLLLGALLSLALFFLLAVGFVALASAAWGRWGW